MKRAVITLVALVLALAVGLPALAQDAARFAGTWKLNADKSDMGGGGRAGGGQRGGGMGGAMATGMTIKAGANELTVQRGDQTTVYKLDGSEFTIPGMRGEAKAKARLDGGKIVVESSQTMEMQGNTMTMSSKETWAVEGGSLVITAVRTTPRGDRTTKMVYDKQ